MCDCECGHHDWADDDSVHGQLVYDLKDRPIHPLPKRKRLLDPASLDPHSPDQVPSGITGSISEYGSDQDQEEEEEDRSERGVRSLSSKSQEPALDLRTSGEQEYGDGRAYYPPRKRTESPSASRHLLHQPQSDSTSTPPAESTRQDLSFPSSDSAPTTPSSHPYPSSDTSNQEPAEPKDYGLFGEDGVKIAKSLTSASSFSTAGLFGGLGLASLHPTVGSPSAVERHYEEEEDGDEDTYGVVDRSRPPVEPTPESTVAATALGLGGSNKKKRKIPGLIAGNAPPPMEPSETPISNIPPAQNRVRAREEEPSPTREHTRDTSNEWLPLKGEAMKMGKSLRKLFQLIFLLPPFTAPVNPPTTAKAALAKLRVRPPHVSLCSSCFTTRRHRRKRFRTTCSKQQPLPLPSAPNFVPPAMPREGPPKLPPGSGLKGSKALKAAAKMAKEREKEKERIRKMFGGVKLPDLYDPEGKENPAPSVVSRMIAREIEKKRSEINEAARSSSESPAKSPSGYPTPPASSDDGEGDHSFPWAFESSPPELDTFDFHEPASELIESRWANLRDQKKRIKAAKERAAKAREEEKERRREKEEREKAEKAAAIAAPPTPAATPQRKSTTIPPPPPLHQHPHSTHSQSSASRLPPPTLPPTDTPPAPPPASALPSPPLAPTSSSPLPPRKAPLKKGRKKRSAHANAHNVHHRDNYVPSRVPVASAQQSSHSNDPSFGPTSWPASEEAIASAGPYASTCGGGHYCSPDEWLCLFCEYELFYGEESALLRAVRKRKGVLKVRQKAKDRAMKATQGKSHSVPVSMPEGSSQVEAGGDGQEEEEEDEE